MAEVMAVIDVRPPSIWASYRAVLASRVRAQRQYRSSFVLDVIGSFAVGVAEFLEVWIIMQNVTALGGLSLTGMMLMFGLANVSWSIADMFFGHLDNLPTYLREGRMEAFFLRPQPILLQLITSEVSLRRLGRMVMGIACLGYGLAVNDISWSVDKIAMILVAVSSAVVLFGSLFVMAAGLQFHLIDAPEMANAFTYGGSYAAQQPTPVFDKPLQLVFGLILPVTFTAYLPTLWLLGSAGPLGWPLWLAWLAPVAAGWVLTLALLVWRHGCRHYQGGGG